MNDPRNMQAALQAVRHGAHAQGTLSYTTSPAHTLQTCARPDRTAPLEPASIPSLIKDMSGILHPDGGLRAGDEINAVTSRLHLRNSATTRMTSGPAEEPSNGVIWHDTPSLP